MSVGITFWSLVTLCSSFTPKGVQLCLSVCLSEPLCPSIGQSLHLAISQLFLGFFPSSAGIGCLMSPCLSLNPPTALLGPSRDPWPGGRG